MITHHVKPSTRTRFARSTREAFGIAYPMTPRTNWGDRAVFAICAVGAVALVWMGVLP